MPPLPFSLVRIVGNSLPPRHSPQSTFENVKYILENEPDFEGCKKSWLFNRIVDQDELARLIALVTQAGQPHHIIPFSPEEHYAAFLDDSGIPRDFSYPRGRIPFSKDYEAFRKEWRLRHKSQTLVHINNARNTALKIGRAGARWVLPLDGGVTIKPESWPAIAEAANTAGEARYMVIPMLRVHGFAEIAKLPPNPPALVEPQIALRNDAEEDFDENMRYGNLNKVELFKRLAIPGPWDNWPAAFWDKVSLQRPRNPSPFVTAGYCIRLPSGAPPGIRDNNTDLWQARFSGVERLSEAIDQRFGKTVMEAQRQKLPAHGSVSSELAAICAELAAQTLPTIPEKLLPGPSKDKHDFSSPARGNAFDAAMLCTAAPANAGEDPSLADAARLRHFARHSFLLAVGGLEPANAAFTQKSWELVKAWTVDPATRMNPLVRFASFDVKSGQSEPPAILDVKELWLLAPTMKCIEAAGIDITTALPWVRQFLQNFVKTPAFTAALALPNHISTWAMALQASLAIAAGDAALAIKLLREAPLKLAEQLVRPGLQIFEVTGENPAGRCMCNMEAWLALVWAASEAGMDLSGYTGANGEGLVQMTKFLAANPLDGAAAAEQRTWAHAVEHHLFAQKDATRAGVPTYFVDSLVSSMMPAGSPAIKGP
ncbi:MAG: alginate lyase family protein [Hyphomicrobiales bacterium]